MAQSQQSAEPRKDPKLRRGRSKAVEGTVTNQREDRHYVLAQATDQSFGLIRHIENGYHKVNAQTDKERVVCGRVEPNGDVVFQGHVLVWIEKDLYEEDLAGAKAIMDARSKKSKGPGGVDNVVGVNGKPAHDIADN